MVLQQSPSPAQGLRTSRIEAFSDGVFSIVITIMVFSIQIPSLAPEQVDTQLTGKLVGLWPVLLRYAITFVVVGMYWVAHNHLFHFIRRADRSFLWLNILFLMFVALVPLPAALIGLYPTHQLPEILYGVNLGFIGIALFALWRYATGGRRLVDSDLAANVIGSLGKRILLFPAFCLLAIAVSFWDRKATIAIYVLMVAVHLFPGRIDRQIRETPPPGAGPAA